MARYELEGSCGEHVADLEGKTDARISSNSSGRRARALPRKRAPRERPEGARDFGPTFGMSDRAELAELIEEGERFRALVLQRRA
jgi:hypothetical protein